MGTPPFEPTPEERLVVGRLAGLGVSEEDIARDWIRPPITRPTLRKYFRTELKRGRSRSFVSLKARLYRQAEAGSVRAAIYLMERFYWDLMPPMRPEMPALPLPGLGDGLGPVRIYRIPCNNRDDPDTEDDEPLVIEGLARVVEG